MEGVQNTGEFVRWIENYTPHGSSEEQRDQWMNPLGRLLQPRSGSHHPGAAECWTRSM